MTAFRNLGLLLRGSAWLASVVCVGLSIGVVIGDVASRPVWLAAAVGPVFLAVALIYITWLQMRLERLEDKLQRLARQLNVPDELMATIVATPPIDVGGLRDASQR